MNALRDEAQYMLRKIVNCVLNFIISAGRAGQELVVEKIERCTQTYKRDASNEESSEMSTQTDSAAVKDSCQYLVCEVVPKVRLG